MKMKMRKLIVLAVMVFAVSFVQAQDKTAKEYKIEGADAYKAKEFQKGLDSFEKSIAMYEAEGKTDTSLYYNAGVCAYKVKSYDKAMVYFNKSLDLKYKSCNAMLYKANALKKQKKYDEMEAVCNEGISKCSRSQEKFNSILFKYYLKSGLSIYNNAAKMQSAANQYASTNQAKFDTEMVKVKNEFKRSLPMLEKAHEIDPDDANCKNALKGAYEILDMSAKAMSL